MSDGAPWAAMPEAIRVPNGDYMARLHWRLRHRLPMWCVFGPTFEYPAHWCARMHIVLPAPRATRFVITHDSLGELRAILPPALICFPRHPDDPAHLIEVWL